MADMSRYDIKYLQDMIVHHTAAVVMSQKYLDAPPSQRRAVISETARKIIAAQTGEIAQMKKWLAAEKQPTGSTKPAMKM